jgi:hypothetical protein
MGFLKSKANIMALTQEQLEYQRAYRARTGHAAAKKYAPKALARLRDQTPAVPGIVYAITTDSINSPIKIGWTGGDIKTRLSVLQSGSPVELKVLFTSKYLPNANKIEYKIHHKLKEVGAHHRGEWFNLNERQVSTLKSILVPE